MMTSAARPIRTAEDLRGRRALVLGFARSGIAATRFLLDAGADVTIYDRRTGDDLADAVAELEGRPVRFALAVDQAQAEALVASADLLVASPSISPRFPTTDPWLRQALAAAEARGAELISEVELFLRLTQARILAVTGTKGKTTTATLLAAMLEAGGQSHVLGGNIGQPLIERARELSPEDWAVVELSELQLPTITHGADLAVYTNILADHIDRHGSVEAYQAVKWRLAELTSEGGGRVVLNADDPVSATLGRQLGSESVAWYASQPRTGATERAEAAAAVAGDWVTLHGQRLLPTTDLPLPGAHMRADILAAALGASLAGRTDRGRAGQGPRVRGLRGGDRRPLPCGGLHRRDRSRAGAAGRRPHPGPSWRGHGRGRARGCQRRAARRRGAPLSGGGELRHVHRLRRPWRRLPCGGCCSSAFAAEAALMSAEAIAVAASRRRERSGVQRERHQPNYVLLVAVIALVALGVVMVYSASSVRAYFASDDASTYGVQQLIWAALGLTVMFAASRLDFRWLRFGAIYVPGIGGFQPAELAKLAVVLYLAHWLDRRGRAASSFWNGFIPFVLLVAPGFLLIAIEPDLGTAGVFFAAALAVFFMAGANLLHLSAIAAAGVAAASAMIMATPYQINRVQEFLNPESDPLGKGYNALQGLMALALGGVTGLGLGASRQKYLYLPAPSTDFIFAIIGEEWGLIGSLAVIALFLLIAYQGYKIAIHAPDTFSGLLACGITTWLVVQAFINMAVVTALAPVTGIPLPFISYGGSSLTINLVAVGILLSISRETTQSGSLLDAVFGIGRRDRRAHLPRAGRRAGLARRTARP